MHKTLAACTCMRDCGSNSHGDPKNIDTWQQVCLHLPLKSLVIVKLLVTLCQGASLCHSFYFEQNFDHSYVHENFEQKIKDELFP